jgi:hypothetical protein
MELDDIQDAYVKICDGYEQILIGGKNCFLKHHHYSDRCILKQRHKEGIAIAQQNGIRTEGDYLDFYIKKGWWSQSREDEIRTLSSFIENLKKSKEKLILPSQRDQLSATIATEEDKLSFIILEKKSIIPLTAEEYADKYYNKFYLHQSLYKDPEFKEFFADSELFFNEEMDEESYNDMWACILNSINLFKIQNIKYMAACGFFQNLLVLAGKELSAIHFYGKPVSCLSINQLDLFSYGASYRRSINNATEKIPDYVLSDPLNLIDWCEGGSSSSNAARELMDRVPNKNKTRGERSGRISSIVGASSSDYQKLGVGKVASGKSDLLSEAENSGGEMGIGQVVKKTDKPK